jgi:hypothetical protein
MLDRAFLLQVYGLGFQNSLLGSKGLYIGSALKLLRRQGKAQKVDYSEKELRILYLNLFRL